MGIKSWPTFSITMLALATGPSLWQDHACNRNMLALVTAVNQCLQGPCMISDLAAVSACTSRLHRRVSSKQSVYVDTLYVHIVHITCILCIRLSPKMHSVIQS